MNTYDFIRNNPDFLEIYQSRDLINLTCTHCRIIYVKQKHHIQSDLHVKNNFCSQQCFGKYRYILQNIEVNCAECQELFKKHKDHIKRTKHNFCSKSCSAIYHNKRKQTGIRKSKLEIWIEQQLTNLYPNLTIVYNKKDAIGSELDIYIPSLKLAFELNGIFHYEPIYGDKKLNQTKENDKGKFQACYEHKIALCVIDTSEQKYFKEKTSLRYLSIITNIINEVYLAEVEGFEPS